MSATLDERLPPQISNPDIEIPNIVVIWCFEIRIFGRYAGGPQGPLRAAPLAVRNFLTAITCYA